MRKTEKSLILQIEITISGKVFNRVVFAIISYIIHHTTLFSSIISFLKTLYQFVKLKFSL